MPLKVVSAYDVSSLFPLYLYPESGAGPGGRHPWSRVPDRRSNLAPELLVSRGERYGREPSPEEILGYVYAVLYDPAYRDRYKAPRIVNRLTDSVPH